MASSTGTDDEVLPIHDLTMEVPGNPLSSSKEGSLSAVLHRSSKAVQSKSNLTEDSTMSKSDEVSTVLTEDSTMMLSVKYSKSGGEFPCKMLNQPTVPFTGKTKCIRFSEINDEDFEFQYILVYKLTSDHALNSVLDELAEQIESGFVLGLVLINTTDTLSPPRGFWDVENCNLWLCIVSQRDGDIFWRGFEGSDPGDVSVVAQKSTSVDSGQGASGSDVPTQPGVVPRSSKGSMVYPFLPTLKEYLSSLTTAGLSKELLIHIMTHFGKYEELNQGSNGADKGFKCLKDRLPSVRFLNEMLLHLIIVHRVLNVKVKDEYSDKAKFDYAKEFLQRAEEIFGSIQQFAAASFCQFINESWGNFSIPFIGGSEVPVFEVLAEACRDMASRLKRQKPPSTFGIRLFWYNLCLRFSSESAIVSCTWTEILKKEIAGLSAEDECSVVLKAIQFGEQLQIPQKHAFSAENLAEVLIQLCEEKHFVNLKRRVKFFERDFLSKENNLMVFMGAGFYYLSSYFCTGSLRHLSPSNSRQDAFREGVEFLCAVVILFPAPTGLDTDKNVQALQSVDYWWSGLLNCMLAAKDVESSDVVVQGYNTLQSKLKDSSSTSFKWLARNYLKDKFWEKVKAEAPGMKMDRFAIFQSINSFRKEIYEKFLEGYKLEAGENLVDQTAFQTVVTNYFESWKKAPLLYHKLFTDLILKSGNFYTEDLDFLRRLLKFDSSKLLSDHWVKDQDTADLMALRANFEKDVKKFVQTKKLGTSVCIVFMEFMEDDGSVHRELTPIQELVLSALTTYVYAKLRSDLKSFHDGKIHASVQCLKLVLPLLNHKYKELASWSSPAKPPYTFYWDLVVHACTLIQPASPSDLEWCTVGGTAVPHLAQLYAVYSQIHNTKTLVLEAPDQQPPSSEPDQVRRYLSWIADLQKCICGWQKKIVERDCTEKELLQYASNEVALRKVADAVMIKATASMEDTGFLRQEMKNDCGRVDQILVQIFQDTQRCSIMGLLWQYNFRPKKQLHDLLHQCVTHDATLIKTPYLDREKVEKDQPAFFKSSMTMNNLTDLHDNLEQFLTGVGEHIEFLVHFVMNQSQLFDEYFKKQLNEMELDATASLPDCSMLFQSMRSSSGRSPPQEAGLSAPLFCKAADLTSQFLRGILTGEATYGTLYSIGCIKDANAAGTVDVEKEMKILKSFYFPDALQTAVGGIEDMLKLIQYSGYLESIADVCEQYKLQGCLEDQNLQDLRAIYRTLSSKDEVNELTGQKASKYLKNIRKILNLEGQSEHCLGLFAVLRDSEDFYKFLKEKKYQGVEGATYFRQQHNLITQQLQHEEYNEQVLNHLLVAFRYVSPFLDSEQNLSALMARVLTSTQDQANRGSAFCQLKTVNGNIHLVRLWFSRAESDSLESIADDLSSLLKTGEFEFHIPEVHAASDDRLEAGSGGGGAGSPVWWRGDQQRELRLHYTPSSTATSPGSAVGLVSWDLERIEDFTRRLGFLEKGQENQDHTNFQQLSSIVQRMFSVQCKLKDLGYSQAMVTKVSCSKLDAAQEVLDDLERKLKKWRGTVKDQQTTYEKLLFFSIPKVLKMAILLDKEDFRSVLREVLFLFNASPKDCDVLCQAIGEAAVVCAQHRSTPIEFVGSVLQSLYGCPRIAGMSFNQNSLHGNTIKKSSTWKPTCTMHLAEGLPAKDLICLIVDIYQGIPGPYEVYRCRPDSTEEELNLFFKRISKFPYLEYTFLHIELLTPKLQEMLMKLHMSLMQSIEVPFKVHYVAAKSTMLQGMPYLTPRECKPHCGEQAWEDTRAKCRKLLNGGAKDGTYQAFELVYGGAGNGKTHHIKQQLAGNPNQLIIAVNESFAAHTAIKQMRSLRRQLRNVIYFSFTLVAPSPESTEKDSQLYNVLMTKVWWFLFDLFFLGYVEDPETGLSFTMPQQLQWSFYFEVPIREKQQLPKVSLEKFLKEFPVLELVGIMPPHLIGNDIPYDVDEDVQLVCKYLRAYKMKDDKLLGINKLHIRLPRALGRQSSMIQFGAAPDMLSMQCHELLSAYMPDFVKDSKMQQKLFIGYMRRRCQFLEDFPAFNYNEGGGSYRRRDGIEEKVDTTMMGSTLMETMLSEVSHFCNPARRDDWAGRNTARKQLVYSKGAFNLIISNPNELQDKDRQKYKVMSVVIPESHKVSLRGYLDRVLGMALNLKPSSFQKKPILVAGGRTDMTEVIKPIEHQQYVLTLDYTLKMLEIHERFECGIPVIIEGETGVGKTALVEMLSILWNDSLLGSYETLVNNISTVLIRVSEGEALNMPEVMNTLVNVVGDLHSSKPVSLKDLEQLCALVDQKVATAIESKEKGRKLWVHEVLGSYVYDTVNHPVVSLLDIGSVEREAIGSKESYPELAYQDLVTSVQMNQSSKDVAHLLFYILRAKPLRTFHKLNIHAALTPKDYMEFFRPAIDQANHLKEKWKSASQLPKVTVFLDEINTSSCLGLLKEVIVDGTFFGEALPTNLFIIAACNPHRGNSVIVNEQRQSGELWLRSTYNVHRLPPTIQTLMWDYGALESRQEKQYVKVKMRMISVIDQNEGDMDTTFFADPISEAVTHSQLLMRKYAAQHLMETFKYSEGTAKLLAHCCVSQRDIQRVFTLFKWLLKGYKKFESLRFSPGHLGPTPGKKMQEQAILVALGIVYYLRLNDFFREEYKKDLKENMSLAFSINVGDALQDELDFYAKHLSIPRGIAKTRALMENLFAIIACCCTRTPLIIVGAPGSSKTLSFNLALSNLKGPESKMELFRNADIFPSLDPHFYQCSRRTTSTEVETVFQRAIKRQAGFNDFGYLMNCVVFMDEAGLPEESHESLKVLHKYLDSKEVAFVAISNHLLDAAKTNRAVSLYRATYTEGDIKILAKECLGAKERSHASTIVGKLCEPYVKLMKGTEFSTYFGLRDFIHMIHYLRRTDEVEITPQLVMEALERNFNGFKDFHDICQDFLKQMHSAPEKVNRRSIVDILRNSLQDQPKRALQLGQETYDEVRYKLIVDPSEDGSVCRLLTMYKVLDPEQTRIFICSEFPEDSQLQKVNTIAAIRHAAEEGKTVLMSQTDDIHESFYDLFNQHFKRIDNPDKEPTFYANIAIGSHHKPCRVHKDFQCVVIIKDSEIKDTPAPFLNRFEKYRVSHEDFLKARLDSFPPCMRIAVQAALDKVKDFFQDIGEDCFYGAKTAETVGSLGVSILPIPDPGFKYARLRAPPPPDDRSHLDDGTVDARLASAMVDGGQEESFVEISPSLFVLIRTLVDTLRSHCGFNIGKFSDEEMKEDAVYLLKMLCDFPSDFQGIAKAVDESKYSEEELIGFVHEALDHLYLAPSPSYCWTDYGYNTVEGISQESCFVVMVFVQWLVQCMCKRLLQLMTAETLTLHRKRLPLWCLNSYLRHQSHFCLKHLIQRNLEVLKSRPEAGSVSTKLVCFTRSTADINQLPSLHPPNVLPLSNPTVDKQMMDTIHGMVSDDAYNVYLCKMSNITSEQVFRNFFKSFKESVAKVMVLVVNMQETKKQMVNYIRIMIEQAEGSPRYPNKLFVLLLHFPPSMFYDCCYPALFLNGWDHHYFDSLQPVPEGIVDIRQWFSVACIKDQAGDSHALVRHAAREMLSNTQTINTIASRVSIGSKNGAEFNSPPKDGNEIFDRFQNLLGSQVGTILCDMYAKYWKPSEMARYLEEAASYARSRKSTLSMTDSVGDFLQTVFHNFVAYMVNLMNEGLNIDNVYKVVTGTAGRVADLERVRADLFLRMLRTLPTPKLLELKAYNNNWIGQRTVDTAPKFPFFNKMFAALEALLESSNRAVQSGKRVLTGPEEESEEPQVKGSLASHEDDSNYSEQLHRAFNQSLQQTLESGSNPLLSVGVEAMVEHPDLWDLYCQDFIAAKFHLDLSRNSDTLTAEIFHLQFASALQEPDSKAKLTRLHCLAHTSHIDLARFVSSLRPIQQLQSAFHQQEPAYPLSPQDELKQLVRKNPGKLDQGMAQFITDTIFQALSFGCLKFHTSLVYSDMREFNMWRTAYHIVTVQPSVQELLFQTRGLDEYYQSKLNIMTAVFLLLQTKGNVDEHAAQFAFDFGKRLLTECYDEQLQEPCQFPNLMGIVNCFTKVIKCEEHQETFSQNDRAAFLEKLLLFFFTVKSTTSHSDNNDTVWFLRHLNLSTQLSPNPPVPGEDDATPPPSPLCVLPLPVLQHLLATILCGSSEKAPSAGGPLGLFNAKARELVARELLEAEGLGEVEPYKPLMYQQLPSERAKTNPRMNQPLGHLYFLVVMAQLTGDKYVGNSLGVVLGKMQEMKKCLVSQWNSSSTERVLLYIELQALLQLFLQKVATYLADEDRRDEALQLAPSICTFVGGADQGLDLNIGTRNEYVLLMHLMKALNGPGQLVGFLGTSVVDQLGFLKIYREKIETGASVTIHLWPFMLPGASSPLATVYRRVEELVAALTADANTEGTAGVLFCDALSDLCKAHPTLVMDDRTEVDGRGFIRMALWLVVSHLNVRSKVLARLVYETLGFLDLTRGHKLALECFLSPEKMSGARREENPLPSDPDAPVLELGRDGRFRPRRQSSQSQGGERMDPIHRLFEQEVLGGVPLKLDPSDTSLRNALVNLMAVLFSLPSESTHLWHVFHQPGQLCNTFLPGFMYPHKVGRDTMMYDCGILLNEEGEFGRPDYREHHSGLSLHSFYLMTWATVGTLCMSLLTNPHTQGQVHGNIISDWQALRHFCVHQLKHTWLSMQTNLELNNEERDFFIVESMFALFKTAHRPRGLPGVFDSLESVFNYEQLWHREVYDASMKGLRNKLKTKLDLLKQYLFQELNELDAQYPHFPSERQLKNNLVSVQDCAGELGRHTLLLHFLEDRHRLQVGGALLPDLVELYLWLNVNLGHLIKYEVAQTLPIGRLVSSACQRYPQLADHLRQLYTRVKERFNAYIKLNGGELGAGGCHRRKRDEIIKTISDETPVINFLSTERSSKRQQGAETEANDWIFLTIRDIANVHNSLVDLADAPNHVSWTAQEVERVDVREFSSKLDSLFSGDDKLLFGLFHSCHLPSTELASPEMSQTSMQHTRAQTQALFDLEKLESDVVRHFIAGKRIVDIGTLWKPFRFRDDGVGSASAATGLTSPGVPVDLAALSQELPQNLKKELSNEDKIKLETDFHDASYSTLSELVVCLKTVSGYMYTRYRDSNDQSVLEENLLTFLRQHFDAQDCGMVELFSKLSLEEKWLKAEQVTTFTRLRMRNVFKTLEMFVGWISDCLFDFHLLPFSVKTHLPPAVEEVVGKANSSVKYDVLEGLESTVSHLAQWFEQEGVRFQPTQTLRQCLVDLNFYSKADLPPQSLLPEEVQNQHYMHYLVLLRRLKLTLKKTAGSMDGHLEQQTPKTQWNEMVPDLWKERLPHFRDSSKDLLCYQEDFVLELGSLEYPIQLDDGNISSDGTGSEIWLDKAASIEPYQSTDSMNPMEASLSIVVIDSTNTEQTDSLKQVLPRGVAPVPAPRSRQPRGGEVSRDPGMVVTPAPSDGGITGPQPGPSPFPSEPSSTDIEGQFVMPSLKLPSEQAQAMTVADVAEWLTSIKAGQYVDAFKEEEVDGVLLATLDEKDLEVFGVKSGFLQKKILVKFRQI